MPPTTLDTFSSPLEAIHRLCTDEYNKLDNATVMIGLKTHSDIKNAPVGQKSGFFYRSFLPLREQMVTLLANSYRRLLKLGLSHASRIRINPDHWAWTQLQPALYTVVKWAHEWYRLACDGENQSIRILVSMPVTQSGATTISLPASIPQLPPWFAPSWLFGVSLAFYGIGVLKQNHLPKRDSEEKLGKAHTRLLLKGARRILLWDLQAACERVRNEEIASAGMNRIESLSIPNRRPNKRRGWQQRIKLFEVIRKVLKADPDLQGIDFCTELDKRHALPLLDWMKNGEWREGLTWKDAWSDKELKRKIRRVRQEALKTN